MRYGKKSVNKEIMHPKRYTIDVPSIKYIIEYTLLGTTMPFNIIIPIVACIALIVIASIIVAVASYALAKINGSDDDRKECKWKDSPNLKSLHENLSWAISLGVIAIILGILGALGAGVFAFNGGAAI